MKYIYLLLVFITLPAWSTNLEINNIRSLHREDVGTSPASVVFDIRWENCWHNSKNHDAIWIFMKFNSTWNNHVKLVPNQYRILKNRAAEDFEPTLTYSDDSLGFFLSAKNNFRGTVDLKLEIHIDAKHQDISGPRIKGLQVLGLEMVMIPKGSFSVGSPDTASIKRAALYQSDQAGNSTGPYSISSEDAVKVAPEAGALYYWSESELYNGDQKGPIPALFPKGFAAFYIMKYELTQGMYASFLNNLPTGWTYQRSPTGGKDYYEHRGGIRLVDGKYLADDPTRPMNYVSFTDGLAFTDWAALRPITELEYEKAARGPSKPLDFEFVWGTDNYDQLERYVEQDAALKMVNGFNESQLNDETRAIFGASYYWVMDLSGSVWEKVITIGNPVGRAFKGSHGDGKLRMGSATNGDWPTSDDEEGGFGYRGGGYYEVGTSYSDFNPHSPIGYRYYGAWSGGPRSIAYGYRAGRSAP